MVQEDPETLGGTIAARWVPLISRFNRYWHAAVDPRDKDNISFAIDEAGATRFRDKIEAEVVARNRQRQLDAQTGATGKAGERTPMDTDLDSIIDGRVGFDQLGKKMKGSKLAGLQADAAAGAKVLQAAVAQLSGSDSGGSVPPAVPLSKERLEAAKAARRASYAAPAAGGAAAGGDSGEPAAAESGSDEVFALSDGEAPKPKKAAKRPRPSSAAAEERKPSAREATHAGLSNFLQSVGASAGARADAEVLRARGDAQHSEDKGRAAVLRAEAELLRAQTEAYRARADVGVAAPASLPAAPAAASSAPQADMGAILALLQQVANTVEAQGRRIDALAPAPQ